MAYQGWMGILIILSVLFLWFWGVVSLLRREVPRKDFYKWLGIIIIMPVFGFILYFMFGPRKNGTN